MVSERRVKVFAFGSNLDFEQMKRRCPSVRTVGAAWLPHQRLVFVGYSRSWGGSVATVIEAPGEITQGTIYSITDNDLKTLDACEGHPRHYVRQRGIVVRYSDDAIILGVWFYKLDSEDVGAPSVKYVAAIHRGYKRWGFNRKQLKNAIRFSRRRYEARQLAQLEELRQSEFEWGEDDSLI